MVVETPGLASESIISQGLAFSYAPLGVSLLGRRQGRLRLKAVLQTGGTTYSGAQTLPLRYRLRFASGNFSIA